MGERKKRRKKEKENCECRELERKYTKDVLFNVNKLFVVITISFKISHLSKW